MMPNCPFCGKKQSQPAIKSWKYLKTVTVSQYTCNCGNRFRFYKSPKNSWTIPEVKKVKDQKRKPNIVLVKTKIIHLPNLTLQTHK